MARLPGRVPRSQVKTMSVRLHDVRRLPAACVATATLSLDTHARGFVEITRQVRKFLEQIAAEEGIVFAYLRHTSASLVIQENADPDVRSDLTKALDRLAPENAGWIHQSEGPDDMPSHVKTMLTGVSLHVPVVAGALELGTWQGIFVAEHRGRAHRREVVLQFVGVQTQRPADGSQPRLAR